jgi:hypothetical protein
VAIANIIVSNGSIAAAIGYKAATRQNRDAEKAVMAEMIPLEYDSWKAFIIYSINLPRVDVDADRETLPISAKSLRIACRRAEILRRLYIINRPQLYHSV